MSTLSNSNILILIIMSILFLSIYGQNEKQQDDNLCPKINSVLCVKKVLSEIVNAAEEINDIANKIEQNILKRERELNSITLDNHINYKTQQIKSNLPKSDYYDQFMKIKSNINKTDFIHLIQEENYAFSYLYKSIYNILKKGDIFGASTNELFKKILNNLQENILCNYRSILHVYSQSWLSVDEITGIEILTTRKRHAPSISYHTDSMIIIRLLHKWIKNIKNIVANIDSKYVR
ncbi:unnamed protein product [Rotaria sordida]|uniref:Uncharacterized protein n=1 Tax=Rotaria sordida TaxID=392033 RepID=A0A820C237_9BILA|nr:unnamed protein product [Rotaria sordida]CAF1183017.1 unnamed protein product [Rotaria sordida]CAF3899353.1 unnamed protein product [Rotaria sordida]CAF4210603.1 unnamed protein product [Rotaria sordida]